MPLPYPMIRLYVEQDLPPGGMVTLDEKQLHYALHVRRCREGASIAVFNGRHGEWHGTLELTGKKHGVIRLEKQFRPHAAAPDIWLLFAPLKHGPVDYLAQKAAEMGASRLVPVETDHTAATRINLERLRANAIEGAEQTGRLDVPEIAPYAKLEQVLGEWDTGRVLIYGDERGKGVHPARLLPGLRTPAALLIGPEGGFSGRELERLRKKEYARAMTLGPRILRADTAAIAGLACLNIWLGDWEIPPDFRQEPV